ncbi:hypothetical protein V1522DRAFT_246107 [Lipomyces starkeyi]
MSGVFALLVAATRADSVDFLLHRIPNCAVLYGPKYPVLYTLTFRSTECHPCVAGCRRWPMWKCVLVRTAFGLFRQNYASAT